MGYLAICSRVCAATQPSSTLISLFYFFNLHTIPILHLKIVEPIDFILDKRNLKALNY